MQGRYDAIALRQLKLQIPYLTFTMSVLMGITALAFLALACRPPIRQSASQV